MSWLAHHSRFSFVLVIILWGLGPIAAKAGEASPEPLFIDIFTVSDRPVSQRAAPAGIVVRVHHIDALHQLELELSRGLPANEDEAKSIALQRVTEMGGAINQRTSQAMLGIELAYRYRIDRVPAIVFNRGRDVIYGITDLDQALAIYADKVGGGP